MFSIKNIPYVIWSIKLCGSRVLQSNLLHLCRIIIAARKNINTRKLTMLGDMPIYHEVPMVTSSTLRPIVLAFSKVLIESGCVCAFIKMSVCTCM